MKASLSVLALLALVSLSFPAIVTSGDAGESWAQEFASGKCGEGGYAAVYICLGNVVKAVSEVPGAGSTFYKPDGSAVDCPVVAPTEMGAACVQLTMPNYCPGETVCGTAEEQVFPGHSDFDDEVRRADSGEGGEGDSGSRESGTSGSAGQGTSEAETGSAQETPSAVEPPAGVDVRGGDAGYSGDGGGIDVPEKARVGVGSVFDSLAMVVLLLGGMAVVVLYLVFMRTIGR